MQVGGCLEECLEDVERINGQDVVGRWGRDKGKVADERTKPSISLNLVRLFVLSIILSSSIVLITVNESDHYSWEGQRERRR